MLHDVFNHGNPEVILGFEDELLKTITALRSSGCLPDDLPDTVLTNIAIKLTGENIRFASNYYRQVLANARHFV